MAEEVLDGPDPALGERLLAAGFVIVRVLLEVPELAGRHDPGDDRRPGHGGQLEQLGLEPATPSADSRVGALGALLIGAGRAVERGAGVARGRASAAREDDADRRAVLERRTPVAPVGSARPCRLRGSAAARR